MNLRHPLNSVREYYTSKLATYGATPKGVDWNSQESQLLRFDQLVKACDQTGPFILNNYGCGYGALLNYLRSRGIRCAYRGFDIAELWSWKRTGSIAAGKRERILWPTIAFLLTGP